MFDLFRSRGKAVRYLLGGVLGLVALSLVITMIPGYGTPSTAPETLIAKVGDENVTVQQVQAAIQNMGRNRQVPPEMLQFYVPQLIDQMIAERAMAYQADRMGFEISDEEVAQAIRSMTAQLFPNGEFDKPTYERFLAQQGLTIPMFEKNVKSNLLLLRLQNLALEGVIVTPQEVERNYKRQNDKVKLSYIVYNPGDLKSQVSASPEEIKAQYGRNRNQYMTPERRSASILIADEARIGASVQVGEQELRNQYSKNLEQYRSPERSKVRHILVKTQGKPEAEVPKLEAKANDLLKQVRAGGDFAELAKKNSEDTGSAVNGGDLGWVTRGQMVKPFEEASFSLKPKEISNLVKTEFGFHIVQVLEKEAARVKPFEEVRGQLETELKRESVYQRMQQAIDQARTEIAKDPKSAETIASKHNLIYVKADNLARGGSIPEVGTSPELEANLFALRQGEVTPSLQLSPSRLGIAVVTTIQQPQPSELAAVEGQIRDQILTEKAAKLQEQKIKEMRDKMQAAGSDLTAAAKSLGLEVKSTQFFGQEAAADGIGPADYVKDAFVKPVGATLAPFNIGTQLFLVKVEEKQEADLKQIAGKRDALVLQIKREKAQARRELFEDGLVTQLVKEGKIKKYDDNIKRLVGNFQG